MLEKAVFALMKNDFRVHVSHRSGSSRWAGAKARPTAPRAAVKKGQGVPGQKGSRPVSTWRYVRPTCSSSRKSSQKRAVNRRSR